MGEQEDTMKGQDNNKKSWRCYIEEYVIKRPFLTSIIIVILILLATYGLLFILTVIDRMTANILPNAFTRLDGGVDAWFSFYTSYIGVGASIVLGIITHGLSVKIDKMDKFSKIREITTDWIHLYDLWRDFKPSVVQYNDLSNRFVLEIKLNNFQPYYSAEIESVEWGRVNKDYAEEKGSKLENLNTYIENGKNHVIHLYFDDLFTIDEFEALKQEEKEKSFHYYFRQQCFNPIMMYPYQRQRYLKILMKMKEPLSKKESETMMVEMCIFVENGGYNEQGFINLIQKKYTVKIG